MLFKERINLFKYDNILDYSRFEMIRSQCFQGIPPLMKLLLWSICVARLIGSKNFPIYFPKNCLSLAKVP